MTAYRETALQCPMCHEALEKHALGDSGAIIDLCGRCGGVWIDWEDGDMTELARGVPAARARELPRRGKGKCPRCQGELAVEVFRGEAEVLRCAGCAGAFVPYASIGKIAAGTPADAAGDE